ncbi:MAG: hypothetical protein M1813_007794 [Trichoglossum hirsutum]|nr:MAG: hypothetical protein M1813_007794 [Trichoglossum hirsutum]
MEISLGTNLTDKVFLGKRTGDPYSVIIKVSSEGEYKVYQDLNGLLGFPLPLGFYSSEGKRYLVLQMTGPDITKFEKPFTMKALLMLSGKLVTLIETLHENGYVHGNIQPTHFTTQHLDGGPPILISFGHAKSYQESDSYYLGGTTDIVNTTNDYEAKDLYASINTHRGARQSRLDDLESLGYVLLYLLRGCLPWENMLQGDITSEKLRLTQNPPDWQSLQYISTT